MKTMRIAAVLVFLCTVLNLFAQNLLEHPDYQTAVRLQKLGDESYEAGDYDQATAYWQEAAGYFQKVRAQAESGNLKSEADALLKALDERFAKLDVKRAGTEYPDQYSTATSKYESAKKAYAGEDYRTSVDDAQAAKAALDELDALLAKAEPTPTPTPEPTPSPTPDTGPTTAVVLPKYYIVRLVPEFRDCLWKIAAYPFVYNDASKWPLLYEANKKLLAVPTNPDLIHPRQKLVIPPIAGETREGTYEPGEKYPPLPKKKK